MMDSKSKFLVQLTLLVFFVFVFIALILILSSTSRLSKSSSNYEAISVQRFDVLTATDALLIELNQQLGRDVNLDQIINAYELDDYNIYSQSLLITIRVVESQNQFEGLMFRNSTGQWNLNVI